MHRIALIAQIAGFLSLCGLASASTEPVTHDDIAGKPSLVAKNATTDLKHSVVVPTFESPMPDGKSIIWCSTLQLAWNELGGVMGEPVRVDLREVRDGFGDPKVVDALNASTANKDDLDKASYVAMAGFGKDNILNRIREALKTTFKGAASPKLLPPTVAPEDIFAYAYLFKNLAFAEPFIRREAGLAFGETQVASFGLWDTTRVKDWSALAKQVSILSYTDEGDWTVELKTNSASDRLIFARLPKGATLGATVTAALSKGAADKPATMKHDDTLLIPLVNYDVTREYGELVGLTLKGTKASGVVSGAMQNIRLRLDEKGAVLKSEAAIMVTGAAMPRQPRRMVCDGPFLMIMMRAGAKAPYFAMWVDNPELLVPFAK